MQIVSFLATSVSVRQAARVAGLQSVTVRKMTGNDEVVTIIGTSGLRSSRLTGNDVSGH